MDFEEGQVLIDFDFQSHVSFLDTPEFTLVTALKETFDFLVDKRVVSGAIIEITKESPISVVVKRSLITKNPPLQLALEALITRSAQENLGEDISITFLDAEVK